MTSILTNVAAMSALQTLRSIGSNMEDTQARVSSGLRVGGAADNAAYWSIATTMRSDNMALSAVQDALGLGAAKVDTAYAGMNSSIEVVKEIKKKLVAATEDGVDKTKIQEEITQLQDQLKSISNAASFSGENWLQANLAGPAADLKKSVVASFVRDENNAVSVKKVNYDLSASNVLFDTGAGIKGGILDKESANIYAAPSVEVTANVGGTQTTARVVAYTIDQVIADGGQFTGDFADGGARDYAKVNDTTWVEVVPHNGGTQEVVVAAGGTDYIIDLTKTIAATPSSVSGFKIDQSTTGTQLDGLISMVDTALKSMTSAAASLGSTSARIELQSDFVSELSTSIDKGVGRLVDADMNEESTRLKALQTQQQLAIQSLSIANSSSQNILSLFR